MQNSECFSSWFTNWGFLILLVFKSILSICIILYGLIGTTMVQFNIIWGARSKGIPSQEFINFQAYKNIIFFKIWYSKVNNLNSVKYMSVELSILKCYVHILILGVFMQSLSKTFFNNTLKYGNLYGLYFKTLIYWT